MRNTLVFTICISLGVLLQTKTSQAACPSPAEAPTNDTALDMEYHAPLAYFGPLKVFNIYWSDHWNATNRFQQADIERALQDVIATPYFDKLCQYGVPGFQWDGSTNTDRFFQNCPRHPGSLAIVFPQTLDFLSCEEGSLGTGVPSSDGFPNPITCGTCTVD